MGHLTIKFNSIKFNSLGLLSKAKTSIDVCNAVRTYLQVIADTCTNLLIIYESI